MQHELDKHLPNAMHHTKSTTFQENHERYMFEFNNNNLRANTHISKLLSLLR